jgi:hypothetical protein
LKLEEAQTEVSKLQTSEIKKKEKENSKYYKTIKTGSAEYKKLTKEERAYVDALKKQEKLEKSVADSTDDTIKNFAKLKNTYISTAEKAGATDATIKRLI